MKILLVAKSSNAQLGRPGRVLPAWCLSTALDLAMGASLKLRKTLEETMMQVFDVQGMSCGHCVKTVTRAVQAQDSAAVVEVDLAAGQVRVRSALPAERILAAIREEGYQAEAA